MKISAILTFFIFSINIQSQDKDLFITYNDTLLFNKTTSKNSSTVLETYIIGFKGKQNPQYKFYLDEKGKLVKNIQMPGESTGSLTFVYLNYKNQNNEIKTTFDKMEYILKCNEIIYSNGTNYDDLFTKFKNIYLVDISKNRKKYKCKKLQVISNPTM